MTTRYQMNAERVDDRRNDELAMEYCDHLAKWSWLYFWDVSRLTTWLTMLMCELGMVWFTLRQKQMHNPNQRSWEIEIIQPLSLNPIDAEWIIRAWLQRVNGETLVISHKFVNVWFQYLARRLEKTVLEWAKQSIVDNAVEISCAFIQS